MNATDYASLFDQVARQTPELAALDADIASRQPGVDALQAAVDAAQSTFDAADDEGKPAAQEALTAAQQALAQPASQLVGIKATADTIRAAIAQCQAGMAESGLAVDVPALRLAEAKAAMWERIKVERSRRQQGGVQIGQWWFHSDDSSRIQQLGLVMMGANIPAGLRWKTLDGAFVTMTQQLAGAIFAGVAASDVASFGVAEAHKTAMQASSDPLAYDYSSGWPVTFGG